jgi:anti-sigma factor (TIGR02949 family)
MNHPDCHHALERLYEFLDGELEPDQMDEMRRHIETCERCYPHIRMTTEFKEALRRAALAQPCCPDDLRHRIAHLLQQEP